VKAFLILCSLLSGCSFREDRLGNNEATVKPWFTNLFTTLIVPKCLRCHDSAGSRGKLDLSNYESILSVVKKGDPEGSTLYTSLIGVPGGTMPLEGTPLTTRQIKVVADWIRANAPLDGGKPPEEIIPLPTYAWISANIFKAKCMECHSGPGSDGGVDLSEYELFANDPTILKKGNPEESVLYDEIKTNDMPRKRTPLNEKEKLAIYEWIKKGALKEESR
jgi:mono/diheme cytochrome c family protein